MGPLGQRQRFTGARGKPKSVASEDGKILISH
jgi:hypothetical protein